MDADVHSAVPCEDWDVTAAAATLLGYYLDGLDCSDSAGTANSIAATFAIQHDLVWHVFSEYLRCKQQSEGKSSCQRSLLFLREFNFQQLPITVTSSGTR